MARTAPQAREDSEVLAGLVERVVFHNPETGFCVLKAEVRGRREAVTIVGHAALISAGEFVQASGSWANDRTHGVQFRASFLKPTAPTTPAAIEISWLAYDPRHRPRLRQEARRGIRRFGVRHHREQPRPAAPGTRHRRQARQADRTLAYATTIHKSQGSEYTAVVMPLTTQHYPMLQRNLVYTGVTRGKRLVVIVGQKRALAMAVRGDQQRRRWSKLRHRLAASHESETAGRERPAVR